MVVAVPKLGPAQEKLMRSALKLGELRTHTTQYRAAANKLNGKQFLRKDKHDADLFTPTDAAYTVFASWGFRPKKAPVVAAATNDDHTPRRLSINDIDVGYRLRSVDQERVAALKASITDLGLRTPIPARASRRWRICRPLLAQTS
ncbi:hypothetical protein LJR098_002289 [Rhizobium sp. LjRoot98]|uniref:hypothetical protein n=1 Tax=Rhizobium sp. LjRoot98 TaxID=3342345 RepID=UPI003ECFA0BA